MAKRSLSERLNQAVEAILGDPRAAALSVDPSLASFAPVIAGLRDLPSDAFRETLRQDLIRRATMTATTTAQATKRVSPIREGFHTITPYLQVFRAAELIDFVKSAFGAEERFRSTGTGSAGGIHAEVRIGDSMVMIGGGGTWKGPERPTGLHLYVEDADATYERALRAGGTSLYAPSDKPYGDREGGVKDLGGNFWYIGTHQAGGRGKYRPEGFHTVTPGFQARGADRMIDFLKRAFGADEVVCYKSPEGIVHHAKLRIGDSMIEIGEAHGQFQPMATCLYMYVQDTDETYRQAVQAGAISTLPPTDQPYGDRNAWVDDPFGNSWYLATHIRDVTGS